jgi:anaerobic selenocysteine-containing dehydrogenase
VGDGVQEFALELDVGEAHAEWRIPRDVAARVYPERAHLLGCDSGDAIRQEIARAVPFYAGIETLRQTGDSIQYGGPRLCEGWKFATDDGKAHFRAALLPVNRREPGLFHVSTRRGKQFNTMVYAETDPLNGAKRGSVLMNPQDAARLHPSHGDAVRLANGAGQFEGRVFLAEIAAGNLQVHWPEGNVLLVGGRRDAAGGVPDYNAEVRVEAR